MICHFVQRIAAILLSALLLLTLGGEIQAQAITAKQFALLSDTDQREMLSSILKQRDQALANVKASSTTFLFNVRHVNGMVGERIKEQDYGRYVCELLLKDGNFKGAIKWFQADDADKPTVRVITSMDVGAGVARSIAEHGKAKGIYGAIDNTHDTMIRAGQYNFWFNVKFDKEGEFPLVQILQNLAAVKFEGVSKSGNEIIISLELSEAWRHCKDSRVYTLAPDKGFMPVHIHRRRIFDEGKPSVDAATFDTEISELRQVDGVWFPWDIKTVAWSEFDSRTENIAAIYHTVVSEVKVGKTTNDDMKVEFPDGTQVHDRIRGEWTIAGHESVANADASVGVVSRWRILVGNCLFILGLVVLFVWRRRATTVNGKNKNG